MNDFMMLFIGTNGYEDGESRTIMASIRVTCSNCGQFINMHVGQHVVHNRLVWNGGYHCTHCNNEVEIDGFGHPPDEVRRAILGEEGMWELAMYEPHERVTKAVKVLRQALDLSLQESAGLRDRIPGVVTTGTYVEMEFLKLLLYEEGIEATIKQSDILPHDC